MSEKKFILAADVGGTKTHIGVFMLMEKRITPVKFLSFINSEYVGLNAIIDEALSHKDDEKYKDDIACAVFGVAGPVADNSCTITNSGWRIEAQSLKESYGFGEVKLINDLEAAGWSIDLLVKEKDIFVLQEGEGKPGPRALISAGTGLGESVLMWNGQVHVPTPSEGGHADFAPKNELEIELLKDLMERFDHVSFERVLSGNGLINIYEFIKRKRSNGEDPGSEGKYLASNDPAQWIADEALGGKDERAKEALDLFVSMFGSEAGSLALRSLSTGGIYVTGGIAPKILKALKEGAFMEAFVSKGRFEEFLQKIPVYVVLNEAAPLMGAAGYAASVIRQAQGTKE